MMKLKINKTSIKEPRIKIKYQINLDWSWNTNNQKSQAIIFKKRKKKRKIKAHMQQTEPSTPIGATQQARWHDNTSNDTSKGYFWMKRVNTLVIQRAQAISTHQWGRHIRTTFFFFLLNFFIWLNIKLPLKWLNNNKKNHYKKGKNPSHQF
jgi:hypothetical protein